MGTAVLVSFTIGLAVMVREPGGEPDLVTGTIASSRVAGPIAEQPPAVLPPPTNPRTANATGTLTSSCGNRPDALSVSRVVEIDTTDGPGFGFENFKAHDFLREHEVVLTFDDGPWPSNTLAILNALADQCTKAMFFPVGKHVMWQPGLLKQVAAAEHTIGSHSWSHADLSKLPIDKAKDEFEKGASAVRAALGVPGASFFRFPGLRHPPEMVSYLGTRNIGIFSTDLDSFDFKIRKPEQVIASVMTKLKKQGKGIILMHDIQNVTAVALPELLVQLKAGGYKVVQVKAKEAVKTLPEYDEAIMKEFGNNVSSRPTASVVRTLSE